MAELAKLNQVVNKVYKNWQEAMDSPLADEFIDSSEREFLLGGLIGKMDPELSLQFPTLQDIFRVKETGNKIKN